MSIPAGATEQLLYVRRAPDGELTTTAMACFLIDGRIEQMYIGGTTKPWTPTDEWELKSILDIKRMLVLDPHSRTPVGRVTPHGVEKFDMPTVEHSQPEQAATPGEAKPK